MKTLLENMKFPETSLYESLLDDLEELENDATKNVYKQNTIGKKYKICQAYCGGNFSKFKSLFDIKKLKQLHNKYAVWESDEFDVKKQINGSTVIRNKSTIDIVKMFADIILSVNETNLNDNFFKSKVSDDLVNILSQAYVGKNEFIVRSASESQLSELYGIRIYDDDMYNRAHLSFVIKPKQE